MIVSFVYPYLDHSARGDELRWSIRSLANIRGCSVMPVVLGRAPEWFRGPNLRLTENGTRERDVQSKLLQACFTDFISDRFVVVSDDTVFSKSIDISEVMTARHRGSAYLQPDIDRISGSAWQLTRKHTLQTCLDKGFSVYDTSTHWPWTFEKRKLVQLFQEFDLVANRFLIEVLYANRFGVLVKPSTDFAYVRQSGDARYWKALLEANKVINWSDAMFDAELRASLVEYFPDASPWEKSGADSITLSQVSDKIVIAKQSCLHLQDPVRFEKSAFDGRMMPVFGCQLHGECVLERINTKPHRRCIACPDRSLTNRFVEINRPSSLSQQKNSLVNTNQPGLAEAQAAAGELDCRHREGIAYTVQAGSRPCVKRNVTVWHCSKHGECSLRFESCLGGKVRGCSSCADLEPLKLVQLNAHQNTPQG